MPTEGLALLFITLLENNPLSRLLALVAERFGWVKVEGMTCEIEIPWREVDCLVTDNPPGAMVTAIKVKGCSRPSETPLQQLSDDIYANRRYPGYIPKETIEKLCGSLHIPISYLMLYSLTEDDVPDDKREFFKLAVGPVKASLMGK